MAVLTGQNCTELQVRTAVMIRTCMGVGWNYHEFQLLAARAYCTFSNTNAVKLRHRSSLHAHALELAAQRLELSARGSLIHAFAKLEGIR